MVKERTFYHKRKNNFRSKSLTTTFQPYATALINLSYLRRLVKQPIQEDKRAVEDGQERQFVL